MPASCRINLLVYVVLQKIELFPSALHKALHAGHHPQSSSRGDSGFDVEMEMLSYCRPSSSG